MQASKFLSVSCHTDSLSSRPRSKQVSPTSGRTANICDCDSRGLSHVPTCCPSDVERVSTRYPGEGLFYDEAFTWWRCWFKFSTWIAKSVEDPLPLSRSLSDCHGSFLFNTEAAFVISCFRTDCRMNVHRDRPMWTQPKTKHESTFPLTCSLAWPHQTQPLSCRLQLINHVSCLFIPAAIQTMSPTQSLIELYYKNLIAVFLRQNWDLIRKGSSDRPEIRRSPKKRFRSLCKSSFLSHSGEIITAPDAATASEVSRPKWQMQDDTGREDI